MADADADARAREVEEEEGESKVVVLTGASRGIGQAIAHRLLSQQHRIVAVSRTHAPLDQLHYQYPEQVEVLAGDLADPKLGLADRAVDIAVSRWGRLDAVVVNHGTLAPVKKVADAGWEEWRASFDINVFSGVELIRAALPRLRESNGRILLTSSGAAVNAYQGWGPYGAAKAVLNHLALTLAVEEPSVTTIAIRPGVVDTEMQRDIREVHSSAMSEGDAAKFAGLDRDGKLLRPEQPGHVMAALAVVGAKELSGKFLNWNDESLGPYQEE